MIEGLDPLQQVEQEEYIRNKATGMNIAMQPTPMLQRYINWYYPEDMCRPAAEYELLLEIVGEVKELIHAIHGRPVETAIFSGATLKHLFALVERLD